MRYDTVQKRIINIIVPLGVYLGIGLIVMGVFGERGLLTNLIEKSACIAAAGWFFYKDNNVIKWEKKKFGIADIILIPAAGCTACILVNGIINISGLKSILSNDLNTVNNALYTDSLLLQIITVGFAAPAAEELLFRGVIYRRMRTYMNIIPAAVISLLIFAAFHGNILQAIYVLIMGIMIIFIYERYHRLSAPILFHAAANLTSVLAVYFTG